MILLRAKAAIVGSPFEGIAKRARQIASTFRLNLEVAEVLLEDRRLPLVLDRLLKPDSNVLDIGCHIGSFLSLASQVAPLGQHSAIEASPTKAALLKKRFPNAIIIETAISDADGIATFEENISNPGFSKLAKTSTGTDRINLIKVRTTTLDSLQIGNFDLVKLDIEGAELAALRGGSAFFASRPSLIFECGSAGNVGLDREGLFEHLTRKLNYNVFTFADFLYRKGPLSADEFRKCGIYPFRAFNFIAVND